MEWKIKADLGPVSFWDQVKLLYSVEIKVGFKLREGSGYGYSYSQAHYHHPIHYIQRQWEQHQ